MKFEPPSREKFITCPTHLSNYTIAMHALRLCRHGVAKCTVSLKLLVFPENLSPMCSLATIPLLRSIASCALRLNYSNK
jgi:hypothetical protein